MLQSLAQVIEQRLSTEGAGNVKPARFAELAGRLLASGVMWRDWSRPEAALYDDAAQCEQLLREWFEGKAASNGKAVASIKTRMMRFLFIQIKLVNTQ